MTIVELTRKKSQPAHQQRHVGPMAADKLVLDLMLVLPHIPDEPDACVRRLISLLKSKNNAGVSASARHCRSWSTPDVLAAPAEVGYQRSSRPAGDLT